MTEDGTLSILRRGSTYQVRYASNNPHAKDRLPHACRDEDTLRALLHHLGTDAASITQACAVVRKGGVAIVPVALSPVQIAACFCPTPSPETSREAAGPAT
jgi:hypothetical protein